MTRSIVAARWLFLAALSAGCSDPAIALPVTDGGVDLAADAGGDRAAAGPECVVEQTTDPLTVATRRGLVRGTRSGEVLAFLGVPYAAPPVEQRRWASPEPRACWTDVRDATAYGRRCPQRTLGGGFVGDEDCLYLNVWTPALRGPQSTPRPVLFFIHGGANVLGAGNEGLASILGDWAAGAGNLYEGATVSATRGVVVVTVNYRLGPLGFLAHPGLSAASATGASGNYALLDLVAALQWVAHDIAAFGGDPSRVLVFGESAGASNTCMLLASPLAKGLFSAALMQSGGCAARLLPAREAEGVALARSLGCPDGPEAVACLRGKPARDLTGSIVSNFLATEDPLATWEFPWGPTVDGHVLSAQPLEVLRQGQHNKVPLVIGSNAHEAELFTAAGVPATCLDYPLYVQQLFGARAERVRERYPCTAYPLARWAAVDMLTDATFTCPARRIARTVAAAQSEPVWRYHYEHVYRNSPALAALRAFHAAELMFVFSTFGVAAYLPSDAERGLASAIGGYWARLAEQRNPNGADAVPWPVYGAQESYLVLDEQITTARGLKAAACDFWDSLAP